MMIPPFPPPNPDHSFDEDHFAWANDNYPGATEFRLIDTGYWNGWSSYSNLWFHKLRMNDQQGFHKETSINWQCYLVQGASEANSTEWEYGDFGPADENFDFNLEQLVAIDNCWVPGSENDPKINFHWSTFQVY